MPRTPLVKVILLAGLIAGTLDLSDALIFYGIRNHLAPERLLQGIASHLIGRPAFTGGVPTALLGLAMHYCIATAWAAIFILAARRISALIRHAVACGLLNGLVVFFLMNYVVLPMTLLYKPSPFILNIAYVNAVCAIVFFIGLPIALINKRFA